MTEIDDIPGTYVQSGRHTRAGYPLNMFCMSLNDPDNRDAFRADEAGYLDGYGLSDDQRQAVLDRDWVGMLRLGGNIYYTFKIAIVDGLSMHQVGATMSGMTLEEFQQMMQNGGRPLQGNRYTQEEEASNG